MGVAFSAVIERGQEYGYPDCCIKSFVDDACDWRRIEARTVRLFNGTGFVPCVDCNVNRSVSELTNLINSRRDPELGTFPAQ